MRIQCNIYSGNNIIYFRDGSEKACPFTCSCINTSHGKTELRKAPTGLIYTLNTHVLWVVKNCADLYIALIALLHQKLNLDQRQSMFLWNAFMPQQSVESCKLLGVLCGLLFTPCIYISPRSSD